MQRRLRQLGCDGLFSTSLHLAKTDSCLIASAGGLRTRQKLSLLTPNFA